LKEFEKQSKLHRNLLWTC